MLRATLDSAQSYTLDSVQSYTLDSAQSCTLDSVQSYTLDSVQSCTLNSVQNYTLDSVPGTLWMPGYAGLNPDSFVLPGYRGKPGYPQIARIPGYASLPGYPDTPRSEIARVDEFCPDTRIQGPG